MTIIRYIFLIATWLAFTRVSFAAGAYPSRERVSIVPFAGSPTERGDIDGKGKKARLNRVGPLCVDPLGNVFVSSFARGTIRKITPSRQVTTFAGSIEGTESNDGRGVDARFAGPAGLAANSSGDIYVADSLNGTVRMITADGMVTTFAGKSQELAYRDGSASEARFEKPWGLAIDRLGQFYLSDNKSCVIRKITPDGTVSTLAGRASKCRGGVADGIGPTAMFDKPRELTIDGLGNLYVVEDNIIRKVTATGLVTAFAGAFGQKGNVDAKGTDARFDRIMGVTTDPAGNVYVADGGNNTIRKITPEGVVSTLVRAPGYPHGLAYDKKGKRLFVALDSAIYVVTF